MGSQGEGSEWLKTVEVEVEEPNRESERTRQINKQATLYRCIPTRRKAQMVTVENSGMYRRGQRLIDGYSIADKRDVG